MLTKSLNITYLTSRIMVQRTLTGNNTNSSAKSADKNVPKVEKGTTKAHEMAAKQIGRAHV